MPKWDGCYYKIQNKTLKIGAYILKTTSTKNPVMTSNTRGFSAFIAQHYTYHIHSCIAFNVWNIFSEEAASAFQGDNACNSIKDIAKSWKHFQGLPLPVPRGEGAFGA